MRQLLSILGFTMIAATAMLAAGPATAPATRAFDLADVRLLDGPFKRAMELDAKYLRSLEPDRLLAGFRANAGLPEKAKCYGGWESRGLSGQSLGHYLSAMSMMYVSTGDDAWRERIAYVVGELDACQSASNDGFLGGMPDGRAVFAAVASGEGKANGGFDLHGAWVPWYNQHKLFAGLRDAAIYAKNDDAKRVLARLGDWAIATCSKLDDRQMQSMLGVEHGGMLEGLADLFALTGDAKYLDLARRFWHRAILDPLTDGKDDLTGKHANTQVPKVIGAARLYELTGDPRGRAVAETFWHAVVGHRSFVTGSNSDREHFFPLGLESRKLGPQNGETCNVYNQLKLTAHLAAWTGRAEPYDYYERALFNHILGSIDPDSGMTTYFQSLQPGRFKVYGSPHDSFWCCTGTGMENHARYGAEIYSRSTDGDAIDVNLFIASELTWRERGLVLRQTTDFPEGDSTTLTLKLAAPTRLALRVRVPGWADRGIDVSGAATAHGEPGSGYVTIDRTWNDGDAITVRMPMSLRLHRAIDDPTMVAAVCGPIVLAAQLGREGYPPSDNVAEHTSLDRAPVPDVPAIVTDDAAPTWLAPIDGRPLRFKTAGGLTFAPLYATHHQRYAVYIPVMNAAQFAARQARREAEQRAVRELAARTVDEVVFGEQQPEQDHGVESDRSRTGRVNDRPWRDATDGGFFAARLRVRPNVDQSLRVTYWGSDDRREFDILLDGHLLATQSLGAAHPEAFFDVDYPLTATDKDEVRVEFRPKPKSIAGGVFGCRVVLAPP